MVLLVSIFSLGHVLFYLILSWKWSRIKPFKDGVESSFSIIIPARNEEANIRKIILDLENQTTEKTKYEVIVVDDFSTDETKKLVSEFIETTNVDLKLLELNDPKLLGKKNALTKGIEEAKNEIILTIDADCRVESKWVESYARAFNNNTQIVAGPVSLEGKGIFANMQMTEFAGLIAFGGVTLSSNNPSMCSGANLGFRKSAFNAVGGYQGNLGIPTGDDEFLLYDIIKKYPGSGRFLKSKEGIVKTKTQPTFQSFLSQRSRWTSKWKYNKNWKLKLTAVLFFIDYLFFLAAVLGTIFGYFMPVFIGVIFLLRFLANYTLVKKASNFLDHNSVLGPLILLQLFYPFHVLIMGVKSIFGGYTWKGRTYG